jgi:cytochrome P450
MALPPGPAMPAALQLLHWLVRPYPFLDACARRFGDTFTVRMAGLGTFVMVAAPEDIRAVFTAGPEVFDAGAANAVLAPVVGPESVLILDGAAHLEQRRLLLPPFQGERMHAYAGAMRDRALRALAHWPVGRAFALHPHMQAITLDVILETVFGLGEGAKKERLAAALRRLLGRVGGPLALLVPAVASLFGGLEPRAAALRGEVDALLAEEIASRRAALAGGAARGDDVLSLLIGARHADGAPMSDVELRDELVTLLIAGHETTATALAWAFQMILARPEVRTRIEHEIAAATDGGVAPLDEAALARLDYLDAVIKESLRLRPIVPIVVRLARAPFAVGGGTVPPGVRVAPCVYLAQRRAASWRSPRRFLPERFLGARVDPYAWLPFGGGVRRCIGQWFALFEMKVVIATVLSGARLRLARGGEPRVRRRGITLAPAGGTRIVLEERIAPVVAVSAR